jgi:hypothetical protein
MDDLGINQWLKDKYGRALDGQPFWRVSWTTNQTETRHGTFRDFTPSGIFIREVVATRLVPKYYFNKDRWVLERLSYADTPEICERSSYEPFYFFQDKDSKFLPLNRDVIDIFIWMYQNQVRRSSADFTAEDEIEYSKEVEQFKQKIGELQSVPHLMDLVW